MKMPLSVVDVGVPEEVKFSPRACCVPGGTVAVTRGGTRSGRERYGPAVVAFGLIPVPVG